MYRSSLVLCAALAVCSFAADEAAAQSAVRPMLTLLKSGRVPPERQSTILEMICSRGDAESLQYVFEQAVVEDAYTPALQLKVIEWLTDAATTRKVKPAGDLKALGKLLEGERAGNAQLVSAVIRLAAAWQLSDLAKNLQTLATAKNTRDSIRRAAIQGLVTIGGPDSRATIEQLATSGNSTAVRMLATAALVKVDLDAAAKAAAAALTQASPQDDPSAMLDAFFTRQNGADRLAAALEGTKLQADVAKVALRYMYSVGRSDPALSSVLSAAAGVATDPPPPTEAEVAKIVAEVLAHGDPVRGESIFRRADLSCMKCHSINRAGGNVGPELTAVGSISPPDYIVNSILNPNLAVKEQYVTKIVVTVNGEVFTGIVIDRDDVRLNLRDASGNTVTIPVADIEEEVEGNSLMPQGLTKFLTHDELLDLVRFVSELGKPGPYAIRNVPAIQRWRYLKEPGPELTAETPNVEIFRESVLAAPADAWQTVYARHSGALPLGELNSDVHPQVLYLQGEIDVIEAGQVELRIDSSEAGSLWIDAEPFEMQPKLVVPLSVGHHRVTVRIPKVTGQDPQLTVEVARPAGSTAQFDVVGGL